MLFTKQQNEPCIKKCYEIAKWPPAQAGDFDLPFSCSVDFVAKYFQDLNQQLEKKGKDRVDGTFMRKGKAGDWKAHFSPELERRFKEWEDKWLRGSDLKFDYGL